MCHSEAMADIPLPSPPSRTRATNASVTKLLTVALRGSEPVRAHPALSEWLAGGWSVKSVAPRVTAAGPKLLVVSLSFTSARSARPGKEASPRQGAPAQRQRRVSRSIRRVPPAVASKPPDMLSAMPHHAGAPSRRYSPTQTKSDNAMNRVEQQSRAPAYRKNGRRKKSEATLQCEECAREVSMYLTRSSDGGRVCLACGDKRLRSVQKPSSP
jgi:hypothetical protein